MPTRPNSRARWGSTLIELVVVMSIITLLMSLSLMGVQAIRETARRMCCTNNLRQIGLALHNYESAFGSFPMAFHTTPTENADRTGASWSIHGRLLPYIERSNEYSKVDLSTDWHQQVQSGITFLRIPVYLCPSEPNDEFRTRYGKPYVAPLSYGFNSGTWMVYDPVTHQSGDGAFAVNRAIKTADVLDGLSHTLAAAEVKTYQAYIRNTNGSANLLMPTSRLHFMAASGEFRQTGHTVWPDGRVHHSGVTAVFTPNTIVRYVHKGVEYDIDFNSQQEGKSDTRMTCAAITSRSYHSGLVNVLLLDTSVRALASSVDIDTWRALSTRRGRELIKEF